MGPAELLTYTARLPTAKAGNTLFCKYWQPATHHARAIVFIAHGYAEHCLLYEPLAQALAEKNFFVFSHDHVGHGQSSGVRAQIDSFEKFVDDVFKHVDMMRQNFPDLDCFICGHSMGGAIAILSAFRRPNYFKGVVLIGPAVATNPEVATPFKTAVAKVLRRVAPHFPVASLDLSLVCSCPERVKTMENDPLRYHGFCKARFGASLVDACQEIQKRLADVAFPFLILQGEDDKVCEPAGATLMYDKSVSEDKTLKMYPKAYHSLLLEPNGIAEEVISDIVQWIVARA